MPAVPTSPARTVIRINFIGLPILTFKLLKKKKTVKEKIARVPVVVCAIQIGQCSITL
jgi:hypothetical protein